MNKYFAIHENEQNIHCKLYDNGQQEIRKIIVFAHGFADNMDDGACETFAKAVLEKTAGTAVIIFNWPCHGDDGRKKLRLSDCTTYLDTVIRYCRSAFHTDDIYAYGVSFGGYLVLRYIHACGNPFRKIALRCPAVNMYEVLTQVVMQNDEYARIQKGEEVEVGFGTKIALDLPFLHELMESDIQQFDFGQDAADILVLHGTEDEVVPFAAVRDFAEHNGMPLIPVAGADHRFLQPANMALATERVLQFFNIQS